MKRLQPLNEKKILAKTHFFLVPGGLKSFHMAGYLTSDLVPEAGNLTNSDFKSSNAQGLPGEGGGGC